MFDFCIVDGNKTLVFEGGEIWLRWEGHTERVTEHGHAERTIHGSSAEEVEWAFPGAKREELGGGYWMVDGVKVYVCCGAFARVAVWGSRALVRWNRSEWIVTLKE